MLRECIESIVALLVDGPFRVTEVKGEGNTVIELHLEKADIGRVIGKQGNTIRAIRTLVWIHSGRERHNYTLQIVE